ncbi:queuosine precursor transporter [Solicola gregarius]|uniref:Probable queuosine precursor transporter n=1 Tax=Solicola gregarius TaxID=2908642 RepID=A0AA46TIM9_9ACTN|nr:queuosine precursor transporter [Solicola gregarius]UYM05950.1 queuosine precursor transporter [Solicola gregarius]
MDVETKAAHARVRTGNYEVVVAVFCSLLLISNISAVKLIGFDLGPWQIVTDGGAFLFPLTYILGDVLAEVFGFRAARRAIVIGFAVSVLASLSFFVVQHAPAAADWENQEAFESILGFVPRIVLASMAGYLVGQLMNAYVLVAIKKRTREGNLWARLLGSTVVGEFFDTLVFCTIAFYGVITGGTFANYVITGYVYKVTIEVVFLPVTYAVIGWIKRREPTYA